jgi:hypothetical protein
MSKSRIGRWAASVALWYAAAFPFSASIWALSQFGGRCFTPASAPDGPVNCVVGIVFRAPFYVVFSSIADVEKLPPNPLRGVLLAALLLAIIMQGLSAWRRRRASQNSASGGGHPGNGDFLVGSMRKSRIGRWAACVALWYAVAVPFAPSIWALSQFGGRCFDPAFSSLGLSKGPVSCVVGMVILAPFYVMFGPIAADDEPPDPLPGVLLTALVLAIMLQGLSAWRYRRASQNSG